MSETEQKEEKKLQTIDFCRDIVDYDGEFLKHGKGPKEDVTITLKWFCAEALWLRTAEQEKMPRSERHERDELAVRIYKSDGPIPVTIDDIKKIRDQVFDIWGMKTGGLALRMLPA